MKTKRKQKQNEKKLEHDLYNNFYEKLLFA